MARRSSRGFVRSGARPNRGWSGDIENVYTVLPAASKVIAFSFVPTNPGIDVTVLRVVGGISVTSDQTSTIEEQLGAFGLILVTDTALAVGITAMPDPVTDVGDDGWFAYQAFAQRGQLINSQPPSMYYPFDLKGKRIVDGAGVSIAGIVANAHASHGLSFAIGIRILAQVRGTR